MSELKINELVNLTWPIHINKRLYMISEKNSDIGDEILNESLGSFNNQKNIAKYIASNIVEKEYTDCDIDISNFNEIIKNVKVKVNLVFDESSAALYGLDSEGYAKMALNINRHDVLVLNNTDIINSLTYIIAHELMYVIIYLNRNKSGVNINDTPKYYTQAIEIAKSYGADEPSGAFAYALYNTYYQERQAFISETESEIEKIIKNMRISNDNLISAIKKTKGYEIYANNIEMLPKIIDDYELLKQVKNILYVNGINMSENEILKQCKHMIELSKETIRLIYRNAMLIFEKESE